MADGGVRSAVVVVVDISRKYRPSSWVEVDIFCGERAPEALNPSIVAVTTFSAHTDVDIRFL